MFWTAIQRALFPVPEWIDLPLRVQRSVRRWDWGLGIRQHSNRAMEENFGQGLVGMAFLSPRALRPSPGTWSNSTRGALMASLPDPCLVLLPDGDRHAAKQMPGAAGAPASQTSTGSGVAEASGTFARGTLTGAIASIGVKAKPISFILTKQRS